MKLNVINTLISLLKKGRVLENDNNLFYFELDDNGMFVIAIENKCNSLDVAYITIDRFIDRYIAKCKPSKINRF